MKEICNLTQDDFRDIKLSNTWFPLLRTTSPYSLTPSFYETIYSAFDTKAKWMDKIYPDSSTYKRHEKDFIISLNYFVNRNDFTIPEPFASQSYTYHFIYRRILCFIFNPVSCNLLKYTENKSNFQPIYNPNWPYFYNTAIYDQYFYVTSMLYPLCISIIHRIPLLSSSLHAVDIKSFKNDIFQNSLHYFTESNIACISKWITFDITDREIIKSLYDYYLNILFPDGPFQIAQKMDKIRKDEKFFSLVSNLFPSLINVLDKNLFQITRIQDQFYSSLNKAFDNFCEKMGSLYYKGIKESRSLPADNPSSVENIAQNYNDLIKSIDKDLQNAQKEENELFLKESFEIHYYLLSSDLKSQK